ncbi:MAG: hypothetical protein WDO73_15470 [Ignavibacteriota bacterium]
MARVANPRCQPEGNRARKSLRMATRNLELDTSVRVSKSSLHDQMELMFRTFDVEARHPRRQGPVRGGILARGLG